MASYTYKFNKEAEQQEKMLGLEQDFTERMWNQTNDWNLAQWNRENAYNSPAAQMERFAMAGINPNNAAAAIAGHDSAAGSVQASTPSSPSAPSAPDPSGTDLAADLSAGVGLANQIIGLGKYVDTERDIQKNTAKQIEANTRNMNADTENKYVTKDILKENLSGIKYDNVFLKPAQLDQIRNTNNKILADIDLTKAQEDGVIKANANLVKQGELLKQEYDKNEENIKILKEQVGYWKEQKELAKDLQAQAVANTQLMNANAALAAAEQKGQNIGNTQNQIVTDYMQELSDLGIDPRGGSNPATEGAKTAAVLGGRAAKTAANQTKKDPDAADGANSNIQGNSIGAKIGRGINRLFGSGRYSKGSMSDRARSNNHANPPSTPYTRKKK